MFSRTYEGLPALPYHAQTNISPRLACSHCQALPIPIRPTLRAGDRTDSREELRANARARICLYKFGELGCFANNVMRAARLCFCVGMSLSIQLLWASRLQCRSVTAQGSSCRALWRKQSQRLERDNKSAPARSGGQMAKKESAWLCQCSNLAACSIHCFNRTAHGWQCWLCCSCVLASEEHACVLPASDGFVAWIRTRRKFRSLLSTRRPRSGMCPWRSALRSCSIRGYMLRRSQTNGHCRDSLVTTERLCFLASNLAVAMFDDGACLSAGKRIIGNLSK